MPKLPRPPEKTQRKIKGHLGWDDNLFEVVPKRAPLPDELTGSEEKYVGRWNIKVHYGKLMATVKEATNGDLTIDLQFKGERRRPKVPDGDVNEGIKAAQRLLQKQATWLAEREPTKEEIHEANKGRRTPDLVLGVLPTLIEKTELSDVSTYDKYVRSIRRARKHFGDEMTVAEIERNPGVLIDWAQSLLDDSSNRITKPKTAIDYAKNFATAVNQIALARKEMRPLTGLSWPKSLKVRRQCEVTGKPKRVERSTRSGRRYPFSLREVMLLIQPYELEMPDGGVDPLPPPAVAVDGTLILWLFITIAIYTGRRFSAIRHLRLEDVILGRRRMREVLKLDDVRFVEPRAANQFTHGLLDFRVNKENFRWPIPIGRFVWPVLKRYLRRRGWMDENGKLTKGDGWLFETTDTREKWSGPVSESWLREAAFYKKTDERIQMGHFERAVLKARDYLERAGEDPDEVFPVNWEPCTNEEGEKIKGSDGTSILRPVFLTNKKFHAIRGFVSDQHGALQYDGRTVRGAGSHFTLRQHAKYVASRAFATNVEERHYSTLSGAVLQGIADWKTAVDIVEDVGKLTGIDPHAASHSVAGWARQLD